MEASVLKHYDGYGAVRLLKEQDNATLLERAVPGTPLSELIKKGEDDKATHILCGVIQKLQFGKDWTMTLYGLSLGLFLKLYWLEFGRLRMESPPDGRLRLL